MPNKKEVLENYFLSKAIIDEKEIEAEIKKMAAQCPEATAAEKGLTTDVDKAYEVYQIMQGNAGAPAPTATQTQIASQPTVGATAAEQAAIRESILQNFEEKLAVGSNSRIVKYLLSRPAPTSYIPEGTTGTINVDKWNQSIRDKITDGTYTVVEDYQDPKTGELVKSKTNYEALAAAVANGTPVDVHRGGLGTRPQGYVIMLGSSSSAGGKEDTFTREEAQQLLTWKCNGFLGGQGQASIRLKTVQNKTDKTKPGAVTQSKTVMTDYNKQVLIAAGGVDTLRVATAEKKATTVKSALSFKVIDNKKVTSKGNHPQRVIRASVVADIPVLKMQEVYETKFGKTKADGSIPPTSPEEQAAMAKVLTSAKLRVLNDPDQSSVLMLNQAYKEDIVAAQAALQAQAPAGAAF